MDIHFVPWVLIFYYFIVLLKLSQLWPVGAFWVGSCVPLSYSHHGGFFPFLALPYFLALQDGLSAPSNAVMGPAIAPRSPGPSLEMGSETRVWGFMHMLLWGLSPERPGEYMYVYWPRYACISISISARTTLLIRLKHKFVLMPRALIHYHKDRSRLLCLSVTFINCSYEYLQKW